MGEVILNATVNTATFFIKEGSMFPQNQYIGMFHPHVLAGLLLLCLIGALTYFSFKVKVRGIAMTNHAASFETHHPTSTDDNDGHDDEEDSANASEIVRVNDTVARSNQHDDITQGQKTEVKNEASNTTLPITYHGQQTDAVTTILAPPVPQGEEGVLIKRTSRHNYQGELVEKSTYHYEHLGLKRVLQETTSLLHVPEPDHA